MDISKFHLLDNLRTEKQKFDLRLQKTSDQPYNNSVGDEDDDESADDDGDDGYDGCNVIDNQDGRISNDNETCKYIITMMNNHQVYERDVGRGWRDCALQRTGQGEMQKSSTC